MGNQSSLQLLLIFLLRHPQFLLKLCLDRPGTLCVPRLEPPPLLPHQGFDVTIDTWLVIRETSHLFSRHNAVLTEFDVGLVRHTVCEAINVLPMDLLEHLPQPPKDMSTGRIYFPVATVSLRNTYT